MLDRQARRAFPPTMIDRREILIPKSLVGQRLDRALTDLLPDLSRVRVQALMADGLVVDAAGNAITEAKRKVALGDIYSVSLPAPVAAKPQGQAMDLDVVYEDDQLIVIDKPKGLVVHPAAGNLDGTLVNALIHHCGASLSGIGGVMRPGIVHRLDKDTSGLMVAAKTDAAHHGLSAQFQDHSIDRAYVAVVWGVPRPTSGDIEGNIGRDPRNRKKMAVRASGGKWAKTSYRVTKVLGDMAALVECRLATGRTHQIRVHLSDMGHPVIGDPLYSGRRGRNKQFPTAVAEALKGQKTQALHAYTLGFIHPTTGNNMSFQSKKLQYINAICDIFMSV